ncbi:hypothetical protein GIB67_003523, partial [Kingdonia uniflora]
PTSPFNLKPILVKSNFVEFEDALARLMIEVRCRKFLLRPFTQGKYSYHFHMS